MSYSFQKIEYPLYMEEILSLLVATSFHLMTTFANSLDPDQDWQKVRPDLFSPYLETKLLMIYTMHNKFSNCFVWVNPSTSFFKFHFLSCRYKCRSSDNNYTPRKLCLWWGILFSRCPSVRPSVTFCFLNNLKKSNCWIFIKLCKNIHICKTNTLNKKVRARGQFY